MEGARMDISAGDARGYMMGQGLAADDLDKSIRYIYIATLPENRDYLEGRNMDYTGLVVMALYKDGTTEEITALCTKAPEDYSALNTVGEVPCVVTYTDEDGNSFRDGFSVTVTPKSLEYIVITSLPTKTDYVLGEAYDYSGLAVTAFYNNNTSEDVTAHCSTTPAAGTVSDSPGIIPVTVSFTKDDITRDGSFDVNVLVLDHIEITTPPEVTEFTEDDPYDYTGIEVIAHFEDGTT